MTVAGSVYPNQGAQRRGGLMFLPIARPGKRMVTSKAYTDAVARTRLT
jgi:hypothetical protein